MFVPAGAIPYGHVVDLVGLVMGAVLVGREWTAVKPPTRTGGVQPSGNAAL